MSDSVSKFQAEVSAVMEVLLKVAVIEITKVFESRSFISKDCTIDEEHNIRADSELLPDLKACMEGALRNPTNKIVCSVGVQVGEATPMEVHDKSITREQSTLCVQNTELGEGLSPAENPYVDLVETVDVQCTVDFPYTIFKEKAKADRGDTFILPAGNPQELNQENDLQESSSLHDPLPSSIQDHEPDLHSTASTDVPIADLSLQNVGHSPPEVISLWPVQDPAKVESVETVISTEDQVLLCQALEKKSCLAKVGAPNSLTGVKKVRFQLSQSPFDCKVRPCSVQLVNLLLVSGLEKPAIDVSPSGKGFSMPKDLRTHQGPHTGRRLCCFTACGNGVWRLHTGPAPPHGHPYSCKICSKTFKRRKVLRRHCRFHTGEKPYSCRNCAKTFALRKSLRRHERFHSGEKPHTCPHCSKSFRLRDNLKAHQRFHTGEKPFMCSLCSKSFRIHKNLEKHIEVHAMPGSLNSVSGGLLDSS